MVPALPLDRKQPEFGDCDLKKGLHHDFRQRTAGASTLTPQIGTLATPVKTSGRSGQIGSKFQVLQKKRQDDDCANNLHHYRKRPEAGQTGSQSDNPEDGI